jgi:hypothetical protein
VTRETDANDPLVISITSQCRQRLHCAGGTAVLKGTIRSGSERTRVRELVQGIAIAASSAAVHPGSFRTASRPTASLATCATASTTFGIVADRRLARAGSGLEFSFHSAKCPSQVMPGSVTGPILGGVGRTFPRSGTDGVCRTNALIKRCGI